MSRQSSVIACRVTLPLRKKVFLYFKVYFLFLSFLFVSTLLNFYGCCCIKMAKRAKHIKYPPRAPQREGLRGKIWNSGQHQAPIANLFENKFWITNRHRHDVTPARMCSKDNARASGTEFSHEFCIWMWVTSWECCVFGCQTADFCFGASFRRSIRPDKTHKNPASLRRLHAKVFKRKPEKRKSRTKWPSWP